jgi:hypothetical protein
MTTPQRHIIILQQGEVSEYYTSMIKVCEAHPEFSPSYVRLKKFPFEYKGWKFQKSKVNAHEN